MPNNKICCNPFKLPQHSWVKKNISRPTALCKEKFPDIGEYICMSCKLLISKGLDPPKSSYVSTEIDVNDNENNLCSCQSSSISPTSEFDPEYIQNDDGREMINLFKKNLKVHQLLEKKSIG